jgi:hypothetical protein
MIPADSNVISTLGAVILINVGGFLANTINPILGTISIIMGIVLIGYKIKSEKNKRG